MDLDRPELIRHATLLSPSPEPLFHSLTDACGALRGAFSMEAALPFNGSGTFTRLFSWVTDALADRDIDPKRMDDEMDGLAAGLSNCITRDGQSLPIATIPMNNQRISNLGDATSDRDALSRIAGDVRFLSKAGGTTTGPVYRPIVTKPSAANVVFDFAESDKFAVTMTVDTTIGVSNLPDGQDLQVTLTRVGGKLTVAGVARWAIGGGDVSATMRDTGVDPANLAAGGIYLVVFSRVGAEIVGFAGRLK